jgi:hypothetical protein
MNYLYAGPGLSVEVIHFIQLFDRVLIKVNKLFITSLSKPFENKRHILIEIQRSKTKDL